MTGLDFKLLLVDQIKHILAHFDTKRIVFDLFGRKKKTITFLTPKLPFLTRIFAGNKLHQMEESNGNEWRNQIESIILTQLESNMCNPFFFTKSVKPSAAHIDH